MLTFNWNDWRVVSLQTLSGKTIGGPPYTCVVVKIREKVEHVTDVDNFSIDSSNDTLEVKLPAHVEEGRAGYYLIVVNRELGGKFVVDTLNQSVERELTTRALANNLTPIGGK